jgi:predicted negative regulator of RcsB-dependent stress response
MTGLLTTISNTNAPIFWILVFVLAAVIFVVAERLYQKHRRAALRSARVWFEYSQMAARHSEEQRGL